MTPTEQNRRTVAAAFTAWERDGTPIASLFADDLTWTITGRSLVAGTYGSKLDFVDAVLAPFALRFPADAPFRPSAIRAIHADGDTVVVHWDGHGAAVDGQPYDNAYAWLMTLRDGLVVEGTAFFDAIAFDELWTRVPGGGPVR